VLEFHRAQLHRDVWSKIIPDNSNTLTRIIFHQKPVDVTIWIKVKSQFHLFCPDKKHRNTENGVEQVKVACFNEPNISKLI